MTAIVAAVRALLAAAEWAVVQSVALSLPAAWNREGAIAGSPGLHAAVAVLLYAVVALVLGLYLAWRWPGAWQPGSVHVGRVLGIAAVLAALSAAAWLGAGGAAALAAPSVPRAFRVVAVAPAVEEAFFRGALPRVLDNGVPTYARIPAASLVFAAFHVNAAGAHSPRYIALQVLYSFSAGYYACARSRAAGGIAEVLLLHTINNAMAVWLPVSHDFSAPLSVAAGMLGGSSFYLIVFSSAYACR